MSGIYNLRSMMSVVAFVAMLAGMSVSQNDGGEGCAPVAQNLSPCLGFIKGSEGGFVGEKPPASCCDGVKKLTGNAKTKEGRVDLCGCLKNILAMIGTYDSSRIPLVPKACGVSFQIPPVDESTDCSKVASFEFGNAM